MKKAHKESRNKLLTQNKNPANNYINKQKYRLGRLKSQENINQPNRLDIKTFYNKYTPMNPSINKNILFKKTLRKLGKKSFAEILSKNKSYLHRPINFINSNTPKSDKKFFKNKGILIDQGNDVVGRVVLTNALYDDIKIRNIINLWNELEVIESYRKYFFFIYKELGEEDKSNFYHNEIQELIQLKNYIKNLTYNIELRFGIIKKLSDLNDKLNKAYETGKVEQFILNEMMKKFEDLTVQTVNIVQYMKQIKSIINIIPNLGKYDLDIISQKFNFDKNYVIKMKFETNFLKKGVANMFFDIKNDYNPFIINTIDKNNINPETEQNNKTLKLDQKIINDMIDCNYFIYKELISYETEKAAKKKERRISPIRKNSAYNFYTNINLFANEFIKKHETKKEKLFLHLNQNKNEFNNNAIYTNSLMHIKRDSLIDKKINNSARNLKSTDYLSQDNPNINKNNKVFNFNDKNKQIYSRKINKNNNCLNIHKKYSKNRLINPTINNSGIILSKEKENLKSKESIPSPNTVDTPQNNNYNKEESKENKN